MWSGSSNKNTSNDASKDFMRDSFHGVTLKHESMRLSVSSGSQYEETSHTLRGAAIGQFEGRYKCRATLKTARNGEALAQHL